MEALVLILVKIHFMPAAADQLISKGLSARRIQVSRDKCSLASVHYLGVRWLSRLSDVLPVNYIYIDRYRYRYRYR